MSTGTFSVGVVLYKNLFQTAGLMHILTDTFVFWYFIWKHEVQKVGLNDMYYFTISSYSICHIHNILELQWCAWLHYLLSCIW